MHSPRKTSTHSSLLLHATLSLLSLATHLTPTHAHGYMIKPAARGSMWRLPARYPHLTTPKNYNDNSLNAGGPSAVRRDYPPTLRFGVCGDPHAAPRPRPHESGGAYGRFPSLGARAVAECYAPGAEIDIRVVVTAHHRGVFRYDLCVPAEGADEDEECFRRGYALEMAGGGGTDYLLPDSGSGTYVMRFKLPGGVTCDGESRCVLRWYWLTGNSVGIKQKEEFWNCADVQISHRCKGGPSTPLPSINPSPTSLPAPTSTPPGKCSCNRGNCPAGTCKNCLKVSGRKGRHRTCLKISREKACTKKGASHHWCGGAATATPSSPPPPRCYCAEGDCPSGSCEGCLRVYGRGGARRKCLSKWRRKRCDASGEGFHWCERASPSPSPAPGCECNEACDGVCYACVLTYGGGSRKACYRDWSKWQCDMAGEGYAWCGA